MVASPQPTLLVFCQTRGGTHTVTITLGAIEEPHWRRTHTMSNSTDRHTQYKHVDGAVAYASRFDSPLA
jgi:hypothetical protein